MEKDEEMALFFEMRKREVEMEDGLPSLNEIDGMISCVNSVLLVFVVVLDIR